MKIVVGIITHKENLNKAKLVFEQLQKTSKKSKHNIRIFYVLGNGKGDPVVNGKTITLSSTDSYPLLPRKILDFIVFCNQKFNFDYLLKIDDDIYVRDFDELIEHIDGDYCGKMYTIRKRIITEFLVRTKCAPKISGSQRLYTLSIPEKYIRGGFYALSKKFTENISSISINTLEDAKYNIGLEDLMISKIALGNNAEMHNLDYKNIVMQVRMPLFKALSEIKSERIFKMAQWVLDLFYATVFKVIALIVRIYYTPIFIEYKSKNLYQRRSSIREKFYHYLRLIFRQVLPYKVQSGEVIFFVRYLFFWKRFNNGTWEPETLEIFKFFLNKDHSFIDIGSWIGPTTLFGAFLAKKCHSIEPDPVAYKSLQQNIALNPTLKDKIKTHNICISKTNGFQVIGASTKFGDSMSSMLLSDSQKKVDVKGCKLEDFIKTNKISDCNFIKIDIEGGEVVVLPSISTYLKSKKPTVHLSLHPELFPNLEEDSKKIIDVLRIYKYVYDKSGIELALDAFYSEFLLNKVYCDVVLTEQKWIKSKT